MYILQNLRPLPNETLLVTAHDDVQTSCLACRLLTAVCVWANIWIFFWMPATLFFPTETADLWTIPLSGHLTWLDEGFLFSLNYYFYSWICLHSWNSLDCDLPVPAAVSGASPCPRSPGCWPMAPVSCTTPLPQVTSTQHRWDCLQTLIIDHGCVPPPGQAGSQDPALTHGWTLSTAQCV